MGKPFISGSVGARGVPWFDEIATADARCGPGTQLMFSTYADSNACAHNWLEKQWSAKASGSILVRITPLGDYEGAPDLTGSWALNASVDLSEKTQSSVPAPDYTDSPAAIASEAVSESFEIGTVGLDDGLQPPISVTFWLDVTLDAPAPFYDFWIKAARPAISQELLTGITFWCAYLATIRFRLRWSFFDPLFEETRTGFGSTIAFGDSSGWSLNQTADYTSDWAVLKEDGETYESARYDHEVSCIPRPASPNQHLEDQEDFAVRLRRVLPPPVEGEDSASYAVGTCDSLEIEGIEYWGPRDEL